MWDGRFVGDEYFDVWRYVILFRLFDKGYVVWINDGGWRWCVVGEYFVG